MILVMKYASKEYMDKNIKYEEIKIIGELMKCDKWIDLEKAKEEYATIKKRRRKGTHTIWDN